MKIFNKHKKWFIVGMVLVLFSPFGITQNSTSPSSAIAPTHGTVAISHSSSKTFNFPVSFSGTVAFAQDKKPDNSPPPQTPSLLDCVASAASCGIFYTAYIINTIVALFVNLGAWLVGLGLEFNDNVFNSPAVQTGFSVSLAIANLGFVLGIIIIALATIIRNQTYGIKQLLWKLVVMAILVNFGLVIMAPIVGFANSMSTYFINATSPSAATGGYVGYVSTMTKAFAPQALMGNPPTADPVGVAATTACQAVTANLFNLCTLVGKFASTAAAPDTLIQTTMAMVFGIVFSAMTAFTFLCLAVLLIIRYLMLGGLLIILPLAWLMWIFPKFSSNFSKWWDTFIKWTFFPPLALFFIYLAFLTAANTGGTSGNTYLTTTTSYATDVKGPAGAIATQTGLVHPVQQAADEVLLVGLTIMGLMFANSLSGKAGQAVVHGATAGSRAVGGYVGRKGKRWAGDRLRTAGRQYNPQTKEWTTAGQRIGSSLQGVPLIRKAGSALANISAPKAVQEERKEDVKQYIAANLSNLDNNGLKKLATSKTAFVDPTHAAGMAQELAKRDMISQLDKNLQEKYLSYAEKMGTADAVYNNRPDLMKPRIIAGKPANPATGAAAIPDVMETKYEAIARAIGNAKGDVINVNSDVFNYTDSAAAVDKLGMDAATAKSQIKSAILKLTPAQLGAIGSDTSSGSQARQNNLTDGIKKIIEENGLKKEIMDTTTGAGTGKYELNKAQLDTLVTGASSKNEKDGLANIEKMVNHMKGNFNYGDVLN
jgi:hypothetical protein